MRRDDFLDEQLTQSDSSLSDDVVFDSVQRSRVLFANGGEEYVAWGAVAKYLDPHTDAPVAPDARESYSLLLRRIFESYKNTSPSDSTVQAKASNSSEAKSIGTSSLPARISSRFSTFGLIAIGACALIAANIAAWTLALNLSAPTGNTVGDVTYVTRSGERNTITLLDGTQVVLNVGSRLQVPRDYPAKERNVYLEGEAQFTVTHDAARPFTVSSGSTVIRDLATRFVVRAYRDVGKTTVAVADGRVSVSGATIQLPSTVIVNAGEFVTVALDRELTVKEQLNATQFFGWTSDTLAFVRTPVREALAQLSRWYDIDCDVLDPTLLTTDLTFTFTELTLTDNRLNDLADVLGVKAIRRGRLITFIPLTK